MESTTTVLTAELVEQVEDLLKARRFAAVRELLEPLNPADIAQVLGELDEQRLPLAFRVLPKDAAAEVFIGLETDAQELLIRAFSDSELREVLDELYVDDTVDIVEEMPANVVRRILANTPVDRRRTINQLLQYPDDSAGSIMTTEFVDLKETMTVDEAFVRIRRTGVDKETIYTCYVIDDNRSLIGMVTVKSMLLSGQSSLIGDIMEKNLISVNTHEDQELVVSQFNKYDFLALPVVDGENRLVGIITVDDVLDVMEEEATEDIEKMAAITPTDKSYMKTGVFETWGKRIPWLLLLMISATFTSQIISAYENALQSMVILTAFIPMFMDTAGNAGSQSSVTIIRGLSLGDIQFRDTLWVLWKEVRVAMLCGVSLAVVNFGKMLLVDQVSVGVALVVCLTLVVTVFCAKLVGCLLPIGAKRIGFDPAVMASPFITTIVDALSLVVYFNIATALLGI